MITSGHSASLSTVKEESRHVSPLSDADIQRIRGRYNPKLDGSPGEIPTDTYWIWGWPMWIHPKQRMFKDQAMAAQKYINQIVRRDYPYQVRERMGRQLWLEFCEYFAANPDFDKAMRYL